MNENEKIIQESLDIRHAPVDEKSRDEQNTGLPETYSFEFPAEKRIPRPPLVEITNAKSVTRQRATDVFGEQHLLLPNQK